MSSSVHTPAASFAHLSISPAVQAALGDRGIVTPSPIQAEVIPVLVDGRDVIAQARTGSGKTLAFALPLIERLAAPDRAARGSQPGVQALVLVPTRELAIQVGDVVTGLAALHGLRTTLLYGGRSLQPEMRALRSAHIVIGTPGRTLDHLRQRSLDLSRVRFLVLDEADEMLDRGFARDVERIIGFTPATRQTALFSATVPEWVAGAARTYLREPARVTIGDGESAESDIEQTIYSVPSADKLPALMTLLDRRDDGPVIVFGRTKHGVKKLAQKLAGLGYPAAALQGNLSQNARERVMTDFRSGRMPILLATNVAARGIDVADVGLVINYELPETAQWFTHRVGRTGRMGRRGQAITLLTAEDAATWRQFERQLGRSFERRAWGTDEVLSSPATTASASESRGVSPRVSPRVGSRVSSRVDGGSAADVATRAARGAAADRGAQKRPDASRRDGFSADARRGDGPRHSRDASRDGRRDAFSRDGSSRDAASHASAARDGFSADGGRDDGPRHSRDASRDGRRDAFSRDGSSRDTASRASAARDGFSADGRRDDGPRHSRDASRDGRRDASGREERGGTRTEQSAGLVAARRRSRKPFWRSNRRAESAA